MVLILIIVYGSGGASGAVPVVKDLGQCWLKDAQAAGDYSRAACVNSSARKVKEDTSFCRWRGLLIKAGIPRRRRNAANFCLRDSSRGKVNLSSEIPS